jgi:hypothetical protein
VIAIDPHKASWTAAAVDATLQPMDIIRVDVSPEGYRRLRQFARRWSDQSWAIEGAAGLGAPLTQRLHTDGIEVTDVPANSPPEYGCSPPGTAARPTKPTLSPSASLP